MYTKSQKKFQHEDLALTVSALINRLFHNELLFVYGHYLSKMYKFTIIEKEKNTSIFEIKKKN